MTTVTSTDGSPASCLSSTAMNARTPLITPPRFTPTT